MARPKDARSPEKLRRRTPRRGWRLATTLVASALAVASTSPQRLADEDYLAIEPTPIHDTLHVKWLEHSFGFYSGARSDAIEAMLPPGFELDSCLKHRVPGATLASGTADFLLEVSQAHVVELNATTSFGSLLTCVKPPPADLGYPQPIPDPRFGGPPLNLPSAPLVFTLGMWMDNEEVVRHSRHHGLRPDHGIVEFHHLGDAGWHATVADEDGTPLFEAAFPAMPRDEQDRARVGCVPYQQAGHVFEWRPGDTTMGVLSFSHFVQGPEGTPDRNPAAGQLCPTGGSYVWPAGGPIADLVGPLRPPTVIGQQIEGEGLYDYFEVRRYRIKRGVGH